MSPCRDCYDCPLKGCRFNKNNGKESEFVRPRNVNELLDSFRRNAPVAIENAIKTVMAELNEILKKNQHSTQN